MGGGNSKKENGERKVQMKLIPELIKKITDNEIWRSVFRHGYTDTPRNRLFRL